ncbi:MAG: protein kinase [Planctomycetales bacterium]|nr:protein kinase [Planctomycetales bacterium]
MLDREGHIHITDFGLASVPFQGDLTMTGDRIGTLRYMSREQLEDTAAVDHRTDIYSLGMTLYELLAGRPAFDVASRQALMEKILRTDPEPLHKIDPRIPRDLRTIVEKSTTKEAEGRYRSAEQMAEDLRRFLANRTIVARPTGLTTRAARFARRNPSVTALLVILSLCLAIIAVGATIIAWRSSQHARQEVARGMQREAELQLRKREAYARDMQLAQAAVDRAQWRQAETPLLQWVDDSQDFRGFEWYHLWGCCHPRDIERSVTHVSWAWSVAFSPHGDRLADVTAFSNHVYVWNRQHPITNEPEFRLRCGSLGSVSCARTYENLLCATDQQGAVYVWDWNRLNDGNEKLGVSPGAYDVALDPTTNVVAVACADRSVSSFVEVFDRVNQEKLLQTPRLAGSASCACVSSEELVVASSEESHLYFYEIPTGKESRRISLAGNATCFVVTPDRTHVALGLVRDFIAEVEAWIEIRELDTGNVINRMSVAASRIRSLAFSHDGRKLAAGNEMGRVLLFDLSREELAFSRVSSRLLHDGAVVDLAFTPDGRCLATAGADSMTHIVTLSEHGIENLGPQVRRRKLPPADVFGVAYLDEDMVCTSRGTRFIDFWNPKTGEVTDTWEMEVAHGDWIRLQAHRGRKLLAAARMHWPPNVTDSGRVVIWNYDTGEMLHQIDLPHAVMPISMPFSPDGRYLAVCIGST